MHASDILESLLMITFIFHSLMLYKVFSDNYGYIEVCVVGFRKRNYL